jgi:hypothetical protein
VTGAVVGEEVLAEFWFSCHLNLKIFKTSDLSLDLGARGQWLMVSPVSSKRLPGWLDFISCVPR